MQLFPGSCRWHHYLFHLAVKPDHVAPGGLFQKFIIGQAAHILGDVGVVGAGSGNIHHAGDQQAEQSHGAGGTDMDAGKPLALDKVHHVQNRREIELQLGVFRQYKIAHRLESFHSLNSSFAIVTGSDHGQLDPTAPGGAYQALDGDGHAVDLVQGVGEQGDLFRGFLVIQLRQCFCEIPDQFLSLVLVMEGQVIRGNQGMHQSDGTDRIEVVEKTGVERQRHQPVRVVENQAVGEPAGDREDLAVAVCIADTGQKLAVTQQQTRFTVEDLFKAFSGMVA